MKDKIEEKKRIAEYIKNNGKNKSGKKELIKFLNGEYISNTEAIKAFCYDCLGYGEDIEKCDNEMCPLFNVYKRLNKIK